MGRIIVRDAGRIEIGAQHPFRWRRFLDFGDHTGPAGGDRGAQAGLKAANRGTRRLVIFDLVAQAVERTIFFRGRDFVGFDVQNFIQYV